jgi:hypothetical protein
LNGPHTNALKRNNENSQQHNVEHREFAQQSQPVHPTMHPRHRYSIPANYRQNHFASGHEHAKYKYTDEQELIRKEKVICHPHQYDIIISKKVDLCPQEWDGSYDWKHQGQCE